MPKHRNASFAGRQAHASAATFHASRISFYLLRQWSVQAHIKWKRTRLNTKCFNFLRLYPHQRALEVGEVGPYTQLGL